MAYQLDRPPTAFDPAAGLLRAEHFQIAYATSDIDRAKALFAARFGITEFRGIGGPLAEGGTIRAELAWVGSVMYELIWAEGAGSELYRRPLPDDGGGRGVCHLRHHHLGYLIHDGGQWDAALAEADRNGWAICRRGSNPLMDSCFIDVPELGHYLELLLPTPAGLDFFAGVPRH